MKMEILSKEEPKKWGSEETKMIQKNLSVLEKGKCLKIETDGKNIVADQRRISVTVYNYGVKIRKKFTVRVIDRKNIGIWFVS